jgi:subtilisin family serine protease
VNTGVAVYDTLLANNFFPGEPWIEVGGTSMGAPQISSLVAIVNQLRVTAHEGTLAPNQLLPAIYQIAATDSSVFQDITSGNNGNPAGPGYDFATGLGTPNAQHLVPDLVAAYATPPTPATLYWTGDVSTDWDTRGNWSTVNPLVANVQQSVLPTGNRLSFFQKSWPLCRLRGALSSVKPNRAVPQRSHPCNCFPGYASG